jgi:hypothetical protein
MSLIGKKELCGYSMRYRITQEIFNVYRALSDKYEVYGGDSEIDRILEKSITERIFFEHNRQKIFRRNIPIGIVKDDKEQLPAFCIFLEGGEFFTCYLEDRGNYE